MYAVYITCFEVLQKVAGVAEPPVQDRSQTVYVPSKYTHAADLPWTRCTLSQDGPSVNAS